MNAATDGVDPSDRPGGEHGWRPTSAYAQGRARLRRDRAQGHSGPPVGVPATWTPTGRSWATSADRAAFDERPSSVHDGLGEDPGDAPHRMSAAERAGRAEAPPGPGAPIRAWHQLRWLAAALVPALFAFYVPPPGQTPPFAALPVAALFVALIVVANLVSIGRARRGSLDTRAMTALLGWDAVVVLALQATFAFDPGLSLWVLSAFPIMGAAVVGNLPGALAMWLLMGVGSTIIRASAGTASTGVFWSSQIFRGSILLLVALFVGSIVREMSGLIVALRRAEARLRAQTVRDDLTGIANRLMLHTQLEEAVARAERGAPAPSLLYLDVDDFKSINDRLGHTVGDRALRLVARRLESETRTGDVAARLSGDEFCVLLQSTETAQGADLLAERLRRAMSAPWQADGTLVELSVSVGVARWRPGMTAEQLLTTSDRSMYTGKAAGRRSVRLRPAPTDGGPKTRRAASGDDDAGPTPR